MNAMRVRKARRPMSRPAFSHPLARSRRGVIKFGSKIPGGVRQGGRRVSGRVGVPPAGSGVPPEPSERTTGAPFARHAIADVCDCQAGRPARQANRSEAETASRRLPAGRAERGKRPPYPTPAGRLVARLCNSERWRHSFPLPFLDVDPITPFTMNDRAPSAFLHNPQSSAVLENYATPPAVHQSPFSTFHSCAFFVRFDP